MPALMNCPHSGYGWCLTCVSYLMEAKVEAEKQRDKEQIQQPTESEVKPCATNQLKITSASEAPSGVQPAAGATYNGPPDSVKAQLAGVPFPEARTHEEIALRWAKQWIPESTYPEDRTHETIPALSGLIIFAIREAVEKERDAFKTKCDLFEQAFQNEERLRLEANEKLDAALAAKAEAEKRLKHMDEQRQYLWNQSNQLRAELAAAKEQIATLQKINNMANSVDKFLKKEKIKLSNQQKIIFLDTIQLITLLGIRQSRGGKTFVLRLIDEYFDEVPASDCSIAKHLFKSQA